MILASKVTQKLRRILVTRSLHISLHSDNVSSDPEGFCQSATFDCSGLRYSVLGDGDFFFGVFFNRP